MFQDRFQAGILLAQKLQHYKNATSTLIVALPRGGVIVGASCAQALGLPLKVLVVKKIGSPTNPELALGASTLEDVWWDEEIIRYVGGVSKNDKEKLLSIVKKKIKERTDLLHIKKLKVKKKNVIVVDDGIATGSTVIAASLSLKKQNPSKLLLAIPVVAGETILKLSAYFDDIITLERPLRLHTVGEFYKDFQQVSDEEVGKLLITNSR